MRSKHSTIKNPSIDFADGKTKFNKKTAIKKGTMYDYLYVCFFLLIWTTTPEWSQNVYVEV